jgi:hypothetical protein
VSVNPALIEETVATRLFFLRSLPETYPKNPVFPQFFLQLWRRLPKKRDMLKAELSGNIK